MLTGYCHCTRKCLLTNIFDIMKLKFLFYLKCDSPKYIAKLFHSVYLQLNAAG